MDFETWEPVYEAILADFGYDRAADERARDELASLLAGERTFGPGRLDFAGKTVAIAGPATGLEADLDRAVRADIVIGASTAAERLRAAGVGLDCMVTDLDGAPETAVELAAEGTPVAVHAHGDNRPLLREYVPRLAPSAVIPTTQAAPTGPVCNVGGFTDGDRAAFLGDARGAARLTFPGWDLQDDSVGPEKSRKLAWAERLLAWLESRRGERFEILDGRRESIDSSVLSDAREDERA